MNDDEDDQVQELSNSNVQDDTNQVSASGFHDNEQDQVASTSSLNLVSQEVDMLRQPLKSQGVKDNTKNVENLPLRCMVG